MRKIASILLLAILSVNSFALTVEEESTVKKMDARNIFNKQRTEQEWQEPIKTIDAASAIIKADSRQDKKIEKNRRYTYRKTSALFRSDKEINHRIDDIESNQIDQQHEINESKEHINNQAVIDILLGIGVLIAIIL